MLKIATAALAALALAGTAEAKPRCAMSAPEKAWVEASLRAWDQVATARLKLLPQNQPTIIMFDAKCRFERVGAGWRPTPHSGSILLPDGNTVPAQVTSFAGQDDKTGQGFFVMALPSVWEAAKVPVARDWKGLTAVFLHEFSHTRQLDPLKPAFAAAEAARKMPDDFSDDSLQEHFQSDPAYVAVIEKEIGLLFKAAAEPDPAAARKLVREALALIEARQKRWFVGEDAYWKKYDDLFLTMEGFGQWVAYAWLADPAGGRMEAGAARDKMAGTRWWSQNQGLALYLVIDRFVPDWPQRTFAAQPALGLDLLRLAAASS